jgi:hypothetical protein
MKLRDIFTEAFWEARWKNTMDGFAAYGRALCGQPPFDPPPEQAPAEQPKAEQPKPAPDTKPQQPG